MKVKKAENVASLASPENVRGRDAAKEIRAVTAEKTIVQVPWPVMVFHHLAPTRQCRPMMKVSAYHVSKDSSNMFSGGILLFKMNMTAVK